MSRRWARARDDTGAAALEFALVSFVLFPLVFGMIDYGLYFTDSLGARDGVRVAARQGVVENFPTSCPDIDGSRSGNDDGLENLACAAVSETGAIGGTTYARVSTAAPWKRGNDLQVCVAVTGEGVTGLVPMPNGRVIRTTLVMRIEQQSKAGDRGDGTNSPLVGEANSTKAPDVPNSLWSGWCT